MNQPSPYSGKRGSLLRLPNELAKIVARDREEHIVAWYEYAAAEGEKPRTDLSFAVEFESTTTAVFQFRRSRAIKFDPQTNDSGESNMKEPASSDKCELQPPASYPGFYGNSHRLSKGMRAEALQVRADWMRDWYAYCYARSEPMPFDTFFADKFGITRASVHNIRIKANITIPQYQTEVVEAAPTPPLAPDLKVMWKKVFV